MLVRLLAGLDCEDMAQLVAAYEAKYGAPVLSGARTPPRTVFDKLSKQYTGSARAAHAEVRWFSPD